MFVTRDGRLLVNELAPRPHNSGHWTIDACAVSQFEQLVRAVCGLPLGDPGRFADAVMDNLLGAEVERWPTILAEPGARLHLYGKGEIRPGRKLGHVTRLTRIWLISPDDNLRLRELAFALRRDSDHTRRTADARVGPCVPVGPWVDLPSLGMFALRHEHPRRGAAGPAARARQQSAARRRHRRRAMIR